MRVRKDTPFEFSFMPWEVEPPKTALMVLVKGTFDIVPGGQCAISNEQVPPNGPIPHEDGESPSLQFESDYAVLKPRAEWYLKGSAMAPGGRPTTLVPVVVKVGALEKRLTVWGDRHWKRGLVGLRPSDPLAFTKMPLRWERSFGGRQSPANPVGLGLDAVDSDDGPRVPMPNIEDPSRPILSKDDRPAPAGLFPVPGTWRDRMSRTGTYDRRWKEQRWPYFPADFSYGFFNCAPQDQQQDGYWRGDEAITLAGLNAEHPKLSTRLAALRARAFVEWERARDEATAAPSLEEVSLRLDTIAIDTDAMKVICQWRGLVQVADSRMSDVAQLFFVHEPLGADLPKEHWEQRLRRLILDEEAEMVGEPEPTDEDPAVESPQSEASLLPAEPNPFDREAASQVIGVALAALEAMLPPGEAPSASEARRKLAEMGIDLEDELADPEPVAEVPDVDVLPESLWRLAAIIRRRLGRPFRGEDLTRAPFRGLDLSGVDFSESILADIDLRAANVSGARFDGAVLQRARLDGSDLRGASLTGAELSGASLQSCRLDGATLDAATGTRVSLRGAILTRASLVRSALEESDLSGCTATDADFSSADLSESNLTHADLTKAVLADASLEGVQAHGACLERCHAPNLRASLAADFTNAKLVLMEAPGAQLQGTRLDGTDFAGSNLEGADLSEARGSKPNFVRCNLRGACLDFAWLPMASWISADLFEASFQESDVRGADFRGAHLFSANLWRALTGGALFEGSILDRTLLEER